MTLAPSAPQGGPEPRPDERQGPDFADAKDLGEIAVLLLALGGAAWLWSELADRLGDRVRRRITT